MGCDSPTERPAQDVLTACYETLTHRLFPDPLWAAPAQDVEAFLGEWQACLDRARMTYPFDPLKDLLPLEPGELADSPTRAEYEACCRAIRAARLPLLLHLARQATPFDPASHTIGVHNLALTVGRQARHAGFPVDLPLLSAAAYTHDVGKFGCREEEAAQTPLLHYKYTEQWLLRQGLSRIARVAVRHAIWDMEDEALAFESKCLILADVRVRGFRTDGRERVRIVSLEEARRCIREKILNPTPEKVSRFERAFARLTDFARTLEARGVPAADQTL